MIEENKSSSFKVSFDEALRGDLKKHFKKIRNMENGCNLYSMVVDIVEKSLLEVALEETRGNQCEASRVLGLNRNTLKRKIDEHRIKIKK